MTFPIAVTFRGLAGSEALEADIREQAETLGRLYDRIQSCRVFLEVPHRHHHDGRRFNVRLELVVPGDSIVVSHEGAPAIDLDDTAAALHKRDEADSVLQHPRVAVHEAFRRMQRRLQDYARRQRGDVKSHHVRAEA